MLQKSTLLFLRALAVNNNREWFATNKSRYEQASVDFEHFVAELLSSFAKLNHVLKDLTPKDCIFRIYRDIRFSLDKTPYKTNFGAGINQGGKKVQLAGAYIHIEPGNRSFLAGGRWMPEKNDLKKIRQEIDYQTDEFLSIINHKEFKKRFGTLEDYKLKKAPKDYDSSHPHIEWLKYTSYIVSMPVADEVLCSEKAIKVLTDAYKSMIPFLNFLNRSLD
jgi:uncharacterized protein (TIGR02453 family)